MSQTPVVVLHAPLSDPEKLEAFVEECLKQGTRLIAVAGEGADVIEDMIDWIVVGDGSQQDRFIVTSSHPDEPLEDVLEFVACWDGGSAVREVRF